MNYYRVDSDDEYCKYLPKAEPLALPRELAAVPVYVSSLLVLLGVLFLTSTVRFPYYKARAAENTIAAIALIPPRGDILDRHGAPLAVNHLAYDCYFITSDDVESDIAELRALGEFLRLPQERLESVILSRREAGSTRSMASELWAAGKGHLGARSLIVKRDLNQVEVTALLERSNRFPRSYVEQAYRRSYPAGEVACHVVGYTGEISQTELNEWGALGYRAGDVIGKAGLERQYDRVLRGRAGQRLVAVDVRGRIVGEADSVPAVVSEGGAVVVHGDDVAILENGKVVDFPGGARVSMSGGVVEVTEVGLSRTAGTEQTARRTVLRDTGSGGDYGEWHVFRDAGQVAILDGEVVLRPAVEPPQRGLALNTTLDLAMQREIDRILGNTVGGVVAMDPRDGSILALVSEPGFDPNLFAPGGVDQAGWQAINDDPHRPLLNRPVQNAYVPGSTFKIVTATAAGENGLLYPGASWFCPGSLTAGNRVFRCWRRSGHGTQNFVDALANSCDVAFWTMAGELGHDVIADVARQFGLGQPLGIDLPDEKGGLIPDEEYKLRRWNERWYLGDTYNMGIGQGFVQCTVLQIARMTACIANGGWLVPPHLNKLLAPAQSSIERLPAGDDTIRQVQLGMRAVVVSGTGRSCNLSWIQIAGKTGTADDPPRPDPHSWFTSYGPFENPLLVITVFCENGGHGDEKAAPMARRIWESASVRAYLAEQGYPAAAPQAPR